MISSHAPADHIDVLLELQQLRGRVANIDEDQVDLAVVRCARAYRLLGGSRQLSWRFWRGLVRELLAND